MKLSHHAVRRHRLLRISQPLAQIQRADQRRNARRHVHHRAAREIQRREPPTECRIQQPALAPHHVRHRVVHQQRPQRQEQQHGAEFHPLRKRPGDQRRRDDGKHQLVDHERLVGNGGRVIGVRLQPDALQEEVVETANEAMPLAKGQAVSDQGPQDGDHRHHGETLHHRAQNILLAHQAAIEQRQPRPRHEQHQRRAHQHPGVVGRALGLRGRLLDRGQAVDVNIRSHHNGGRHREDAPGSQRKSHLWNTAEQTEHHKKPLDQMFSHRVPAISFGKPKTLRHTLPPRPAAR